MVKLQVGGREVQGEPVPFNVSSEQWQTIRLEDGTELRLSTIVLDVYKIQESSPSGQPLYVVRTTNGLLYSPPREESAPEKQSPEEEK